MENIISEVGVLGNVLKHKKKKSHERRLLFIPQVGTNLQILLEDRLS
ncbi:TPA: hypothetical protein RD718_002593 [Enterococcus faecium]|nr:hypothetical protein [Enterococcus faecium]